MNSRDSINLIKKAQIEEYRKDIVNLQEVWRNCAITKNDIIKDLNNYFWDKEMPRVIPNHAYNVGNLNEYYPQFNICSLKKLTSKWIDLSAIKGHHHQRDKLFSNKEYEIKVMTCVWLNNEGLCQKLCQHWENCNKSLPQFRKILDNYYVNEGKHRTYAHFLLGYEKIKAEVYEYNYAEVANNFNLIISDKGEYKLEKKGFERVSTNKMVVTQEAISNLKSININIIDKTSPKFKIKKIIRKIVGMV